MWLRVLACQCSKGEKARTIYAACRGADQPCSVTALIDFLHRLPPSTTVVVIPDLAAYPWTALIEEPFDEAVSTPMSVPKSRQKRSTFDTDFGAEIDPQSTKIGQFLELFEVKTLPDRPLEPKGRPEGFQEGPQRLPRDPLGPPRRPKAAPCAPQGRPRKGPRGAPSPPRAARSTPKIAKSNQKRPPDRFGRRFRSKIRFATDFRAIFG